jgi:protein tyrosine phosphatase (PTP) superfamily phosphohydrolase (DUF442 family)
VKTLLRLPGLLLRLGLLGLFLSVPAYLLLHNFAFVEPYLYPLHLLQARQSMAGPELLLGPYPDHAELSRLKDQGYRTVVSLLTPQLVYERSLLDRERDNARSLGMTFYNFPMNSDEPTSSRMNAVALRAIDRLLRQHPGQQLYIHCYLGKHRSVMVARWLLDRRRERLLATTTP